MVLGSWKFIAPVIVAP